ncbi:MAG: peptidylprolyl isomerase [Actinobacteria bacterium HGW-Actinobacteria-1]|jgi:peptidyl-prolyl cis-trans isomerase C|nr:MAG: peptidylprolyl isomerase [Actinobacteria bacterium HGW-Actinobacteria-1]
MPRAAARHILVATEEQANDLKQQIADGADFAEIARTYSSCPSGHDGGDLGVFAPGQMVREFNDVCFNEAVGVVHGPVKTQFGYHLIEVTMRDE